MPGLATKMLVGTHLRSWERMRLQVSGLWCPPQNGATKFSEVFTGSGWYFKGASNEAARPGHLPEPRFWFMPLLLPDGGADDKLTRELWELHLQPLLRPSGRNFNITRAYANGQLHGTDGSPHRDASPTPPHFTLLYYPHDMRHGSRRQQAGFGGNASAGTSPASRDAGGETVFFHGETGRTLAVIPMRANSAVLFPGSLVHAGRAPAVNSPTELRVTVAFKLIQQS
eukprot:gnl/TRDRNA2_/TRDRNA2_161227_c0_seq3.p2 gnl/TRDRNA2_/TRDRNA2_161227_c0~~gnl/TRDRNA2_/TRDRNA2_161227_c0_seq3.p2  ORF type:complete len:227 (+),score=31.25 gnl/TRDRNA2_/TRDRNA2_161227_c0_seq3:171-851(+)